MTCDRVLELAGGFLDGTLPGAARATVADHLEGCDDCRGLIAALRDTPPEDPRLTAEILQRTSGPVCESAQARLCDWIDATLAANEAALVGGHLERCPECAALGRVLASMSAELPRLAEADPDPGFVAGVLARTSRRPRPPSLAERWLASLQTLLERPRIALEGAFVAAMIVVLPLGALPPRGGAATTEAVDAVRLASGTASARLTILAHDAWAATRGLVAEHATGIAAGIENLAGTFSSADASGQTSDGAGALDRQSGSAQEKRR